MPWKCPACALPIRHGDLEEAPRPGVHYRCHICRLDLVFSPSENRMVLLPLDDEPARPHES